MSASINHPALPFALTAFGDLPVKHAVDKVGTLTLTGAATSDLFIDPNGSGGDYAAGMLLGLPPEGDFTLSARVAVPFASMFDAAVFVVYVARDRFAKLCFEYSPQLRPTIVSVVTKEVSDDANAFSVEGSSASLRVSRIGPAWAFHASTDDKHWSMVRYFSLGESEEPARVGMVGQSPTGEGISVTFTELTYTARTLTDVRDGT
ncbi:DUF1349 domain-containing protein [Actinospica durhamensis]|uniref:DUF1349 domain-containing protein n=1 Tax=Actinospica durhamensis TaxID=1508375 RepID=A0A941IV82_9ACTN|nr:DUF1349 domain-containing protein [Actinospica durhamensis]MBR7836636.1 DUF1349 domain-containing protein [Actinospica durhamensis]